MKIYTDLPNVPVTSKQKQRVGNVASKAGNTFAESLRGAMNSVHESTDSPQTAALHRVTATTQTRLQTEAMTIGEQALSLIEHLYTRLDNHETSQGLLDTIASGLSDQVERLRAIRDSLEEGDPLKQMIEQIGILSAVESAKINRGNYSS